MEKSLEDAIDDFGKSALRVKAQRDEVIEAASDFAKLVMVEHFDLNDIAVHRAYERLRAIIDRVAHGDFTGLDTALDELRKPVDEVRE
jgi:hypothetical protein